MLPAGTFCLRFSKPFHTLTSNCASVSVHGEQFAQV